MLTSPPRLEPPFLHPEGLGVHAARPAPGYDDGKLIDGLKSGDEAGFTAFYDRFAGILLNVTWSILRDAKEAEDALQEAFVHMWKRAATYDPARGGLFTWAVIITRSKAIDGARRRKRFQLKAEMALAEASTAPFQDVDLPGARMMQREERQKIRGALGSLVPSQREALDLAFFGAMTQAEIARRLGVPIGTVKARIRRGLGILRHNLIPSGTANISDLSMMTRSTLSEPAGETTLFTEKVRKL